MQEPSNRKPDERRPSRAILLLREALAAGQCERTAMAEALAESGEALDAYEAAARPMPLESQARLATFVIDQVPALARKGFRLRAQVVAALDYRNGRTSTHTGSPPRT